MTTSTSRPAAEYSPALAGLARRANRALSNSACARPALAPIANTPPSQKRAPSFFFVGVPNSRTPRARASATASAVARKYQNAQSSDVGSLTAASIAPALLTRMATRPAERAAILPVRSSA